MIAYGITQPATKQTDHSGMSVFPDRGMGLELTNVGAFRSNQQVFMNISLCIKPGEFVGILGPSGSGKSTLIEILALCGHLTEGSILFDQNKEIGSFSDEYASMVGYVPQEDSLYSALTVRENFHFAARLRLPEANRERTNELVDQMLHRFGLEEHRNKEIGRLSGGQRKRVSIATELFGRPRLLILDEPTSGLDPAMEKSVMEDLRCIAEGGTTVVCSTHVMESIGLFHRVAVIGKRRSNTQNSSYGDLDFFETPALLKGHYGVEQYADLYSLLQEDPYTVYVREHSIPRRSRHVLFFQHCRRTITELLTTKRDAAKTTCRQIADVFHRSLTVFQRDRFLLLLSLCLPFVLGALVVLSQRNESNIRPLLFFTTIIALWFGMNNSVRSIVGERVLFVRDSLAGLSMHSFLLGKAAFYLLLGLVQIILLWGVVVWGTDNSDFEKVQSVFLPVLLLTYGSGLGLGLLVSTLSGSENVAIAWVPLLVMPQLLLSSVAAGNSVDDFRDPARIGPIYYFLHDEESNKPQHQTEETEPRDIYLDRFKTLSMFCYSRPALGVLEFPLRNLHDSKAQWAEWTYLLGLCTATWMLLWFAFALKRGQWREIRGR